LKDQFGPTVKTFVRYTSFEFGKDRSVPVAESVNERRVKPLALSTGKGKEIKNSDPELSSKGGGGEAQTEQWKNSFAFSEILYAEYKKRRNGRKRFQFQSHIATREADADALTGGEKWGPLWMMDDRSRSH